MEKSTRVESASTKRSYARPSLVTYGSIAKLTQGGAGSGGDGGSAGMSMVCL